MQFRLALLGRGASHTPTRHARQISRAADSAATRRWAPRLSRRRRTAATAAAAPARVKDARGRPTPARAAFEHSNAYGTGAVPARPLPNPTPRPPPSSAQRRSAPVGPDAAGSKELVEGRGTHLVSLFCGALCAAVAQDLGLGIRSATAANGPRLRGADAHSGWIHPHWWCSWMVLRPLHPTCGFHILDEMKRYRRL